MALLDGRLDYHWIRLITGMGSFDDVVSVFVLFVRRWSKGHKLICSLFNEL